MNFRQKNLRVFHQHLLVQRALISIIVLNRLAELFRLTQIQAPSPIPLNKGGEGVVEDEQEKKVEYSYDKNGNLTKKIEYDDDGNIKTITLYTYDYENRLIRVEMQRNGREKIVEFTYDPFGRRLSKSVHKEEIDDEDNDKDDDDKVTPRTTYYVYDNEDIILEQLQTPNSKLKTIRYVHGLGIDEPLSIERKGKIYYYHADGLGSVTALTDSKGKVAVKYEYDSFGNLKHHGHKVKQPYTYTAREWDRETKLYYYRARYYDSQIGRFITRDPIGFEGGINLYAYVGNNPVNYTDPFGLYWEYSQSTQQLTYVDNQSGARTSVGIGYSGQGAGLNNPNMQNVPFVGPIPQGTYDIGGATTTKGPLTLPLAPQSGTNTFGRDTFRIHGDNLSRSPQSSSEGCIVIGPDVRNQINNSPDRELRVVP